MGMAASSIGRTTVVTKEYAEALAEAIRDYRACRSGDRRKTSLTAIAEVQPVGMLPQAGRRGRDD